MLLSLVLLAALGQTDSLFSAQSLEVLSAPRQVQSIGYVPMLTADGQVKEGPYVKLPAELSVPAGRLIQLKIETNGKTVRYVVPKQLDCFREYDPDPSVILLRIIGYEDGVFDLLAYTALGDVPSEPAICHVTVGKPVPPVPPVPPKPPDPPVPPPNPAPIPLPGLRALVILETSQLNDVAKIVGSAAVSNYLNTKCALGADGKSREWRWVDQNGPFNNMAQHWQDAIKRPRGQLPWLIISNGTTGYEGPLPPTINETLELLKKYGG